MRLFAICHWSLDGVYTYYRDCGMAGYTTLSLLCEDEEPQSVNKAVITCPFAECTMQSRSHKYGDSQTLPSIAVVE